MAQVRLLMLLMSAIATRISAMEPILLTTSTYKTGHLHSWPRKYCSSTICKIKYYYINGISDISTFSRNSTLSAIFTNPSTQSRPKDIYAPKQYTNEIIHSESQAL